MIFGTGAYDISIYQESELMFTEPERSLDASFTHNRQGRE